MLEDEIAQLLKTLDLTEANTEALKLWVKTLVEARRAEQIDQEREKILLRIGSAQERTAIIIERVNETAAELNLTEEQRRDLLEEELDLINRQQEAYSSLGQTVGDALSGLGLGDGDLGKRLNPGITIRPSLPARPKQAKASATSTVRKAGFHTPGSDDGGTRNEQAGNDGDITEIDAFFHSAVRRGGARIGHLPSFPVVEGGVRQSGGQSGGLVGGDERPIGPAGKSEKA